MFGILPEFYRNEDQLRQIWAKPDTRKALLEALSEKGYGAEQLSEIMGMIDADKSDLFDVLAYIAFALPPITREERAATGRDQIRSLYEPKLQAFLDFVLSQYVKEGVEELDSAKLPHLLTLKYHTVNAAAAELGSAKVIGETFVGFQQYLYRQSGQNIAG